MSNFTISPNMNLIIPTPGQDPGPDYANNLDSSLTIIDGHNHSAGSGVQITPAGININSDLPINGNNLTMVNSLRYLSLSMPLAGSAPNLGVTYVSGNELYYNDEAGNQVQITNSGSVNAGAGSITGLPSGTASATYSSGSGTFVWQSATSTPANMDGASFIFRDQTASSKGITVSAPNALSADYAMSWPAGLPAGQRFLTLDNSGNIGAAWNVDNSTLDISSNLVEIKDGGVTQVKMAVVTSGSTAGVGQMAISSSCGAFIVVSSSLAPVTNLSVTLTTVGRPVMLMLVSDNSGTSAGYLETNPVPGQTDAALVIDFFEGVASVCEQMFFYSLPISPPIITQYRIPVSSFQHLYLPAAGTYTYTVQARTPATSSASVFYAKLIAYEL